MATLGLPQNSSASRPVPLQSWMPGDRGRSMIFLEPAVEIATAVGVPGTGMGVAR